MIRKPACAVREGEGRRGGGAIHKPIHVDTCVHTCVEIRVGGGGGVPLEIQAGGGGGGRSGIGIPP